MESQKLFTLIYEDKEINGREYTKVHALVNIPILTKAIGKQIFGTEPTPGFKLTFTFSGKAHKLAYPVCHINGEAVFMPFNNFKSNNPDEDRQMLEFSGDSFRNVFKDDSDYEEKIHLKDVKCIYDSPFLSFEVPIEKMFEI